MLNLEQITKQNDDFRKTFIGGSIVLSPMVLALSIKERSKLFKLVKICSYFRNDVHNMGEVKFKNGKYLFEITFDTTNEIRILRIMHQSEYQP